MNTVSAVKAVATYVCAHPGSSKTAVARGGGFSHHAVNKALDAGLIRAERATDVGNLLRYRLYPPPPGAQTGSEETSLWLTPAQAAAMLGVSGQTLARWARKGKIESRRTEGGHRRYLEPDVRALKGTRNLHHAPGPAMNGAAEYVRSHPGCNKADVRHATGHRHEAIERAIQAGMITATRSSLSPRRYRLYPPQPEGTEW